MRSTILAVLLVWTTALDVSAAALERVPNSTLRMPAAPPVAGFAFTNAFPGLTVSAPMAFATPPGETNRLFIAERSGRIIVVTNLAAPNRTVFLDISSTTLTSGEEGLLGLAFHPGYATNRYFYVFYSVNATTSQTGRHQRVARFEASSSNPNVAIPGSLTRIIDQYDQASNHNAGDIHFGPDGYLYIAVGDEGGANDQYNNAQLITKDLHAGILRIDVDKRPGNLPPNPHSAATTNYLIPADNPFVGATSFNGIAVNPAQVRTEFWAVGLRNPWRMSFDPPTGTLYCADVGQGLWEEVNVIIRGGNYGWAFREGTSAGPKAAPPGFASLPPIHQYSHCSSCSANLQAGNSVTGGFIYRGSQLSQLFGKYIFADFVSGHVWALTPNGMNPVTKDYLLTDGGLVAFGRDPRNGEILAADISEPFLKRLVYSGSTSGTPLPATLQETGAFADLQNLEPNPGIVPYEINTPFWSDGATKQRWFSVPDLNSKLLFAPEGNWGLPAGAVWVKHFELELTNGVPESIRRLETRLLVRTVTGVYGVTYRWGDSRTNAWLVEEQGMDEALVVNEGGLIRTQVWHYPSRAECLACHTAQGGLALGFNTAQLNRDTSYAGVVTNQIAALSDAGYFTTGVSNMNLLPSMAALNASHISLEHRVRSYLAANCAQCHQPQGPAPSNWDARLHVPTALAGLINIAPRDNGGNPNAALIKPGSLEDSILLQRISTLGPKRMPPLASSELDHEAISLLSQWITNALPASPTLEQWQIANFGSTTHPNAAPDEDPDADGADNRLEYLTETNPNDQQDAWSIGIKLLDGTPALVFTNVPNRAFEAQVSRTIPPSWQGLNVPANRPVFASTNGVRTIPDSNSHSNSFYRVKVIER